MAKKWNFQGSRRSSSNVGRLFFFLLSSWKQKIKIELVSSSLSLSLCEAFLLLLLLSKYSSGINGKFDLKFYFQWKQRNKYIKNGQKWGGPMM